MVDLSVPDGWQAELDQLAERRRLAREREQDESVRRHRAQGKLLARERVERLLDANSFEEIGTVAGTPVYEDGELTSFNPAGVVMGSGRIDGRRVVISAEDYTGRGGGRGSGRLDMVTKSGFAERMAAERRLPMIRLIDAFGADIRNMERMGHTYVSRMPGMPAMRHLMSVVPVVGAVMGAVAGLPAAVAMATHWSIMVKGQSQIFPAGPPVVRRALGLVIHKEELGGYRVHAMKSGVIDNLAEDEDDALRQIQRFLSYLPTNVWQMPPRAEPDDDPHRREEELIRIIPRNRKKTYNARKLLRLVVDRDSLFELAPFYGRALITALARFNGYPVGVMASDPTYVGGAMDAAACEKQTRFVDLCDMFHLPMINFIDQPGLMVGPAAEEAGTIRKGTRAVFAIEESTVPWLAVLVRKCYGVGGAAQLRNGGLVMEYAWPSAEWGSLPIEGGVDAAYKRDIESAADPDARRLELEQRLVELRSPIPTAEVFGVTEIIDPRDSRRLICEFVESGQELIRTQLGPKLRTGIRP